jgi:hypothetical protein
MGRMEILRRSVSQEEIAQTQRVLSDTKPADGVV